MQPHQSTSDDSMQSPNAFAFIVTFLIVLNIAYLIYQRSISAPLENYLTILIAFVLLFSHLTYHHLQGSRFSRVAKIFTWGFLAFVFLYAIWRVVSLAA